MPRPPNPKYQIEQLFSWNSLSEFYAAIGQYVTYREALSLLPEQSPLYLVVPSNVYAAFFQMQVIQSVLTTLKIKLILVDIQREEIVEWIQ
jgi:XisH protein